MCSQPFRFSGSPQPASNRLTELSFTVDLPFNEDSNDNGNGALLVPTLAFHFESMLCWECDTLLE